MNHIFDLNLFPQKSGMLMSILTPSLCVTYTFDWTQYHKYTWAYYVNMLIALTMRLIHATEPIRGTISVCLSNHEGSNFNTIRCVFCYKAYLMTTILTPNLTDFGVWKPCALIYCVFDEESTFVCMYPK